MAESFHVNGPAIVCVGTSGGVLKRLGVTVDGVRVSFERIQEDVQTDVSGPGPADVQTFMELAVVDFVLVSFDESVLNEYMSLTTNGVTYPPGTLPPSGMLLGASGNLKALAIAAPYGEAPYTFPHSSISPGRSGEVNLGTKRKGYRVSARCLPNIGSALTSAGAVCYHRNAFTVP